MLSKDLLLVEVAHLVGLLQGSHPYILLFVLAAVDVTQVNGAVDKQTVDGDKAVDHIQPVAVGVI